MKIPKADRIELHTAAKSNGSDIAGANLTVTGADASPASFLGSTTSTATSTSASARVDGQFAGAISGFAGYGGSSIAGPYAASKSRDSLGKKVEGSLSMQASSTAGSGTIGGVFAFCVNPSEKIQAAIGAAWDGDTINVAKGTYLENIIIEKSLTLKGAGPGKSVIDGKGSGSVATTGISNKAARVSLSGFTIQNGKAENGGGIYNMGTLTLTGSTVAWNSAGKYGGGSTARAQPQFQAARSQRTVPAGVAAEFTAETNL